MAPLRPYLEKLDALTEILEHTESKRQKILDFMKFAPCICTMKNSVTRKYEFVSKSLCDIIGKSEDQILGKTDFEILDEGSEEFKSFDDEVVTRQETTVFIVKFKGRLYLLVKFLVVNGSVSIGGIAIEIPSSFKLIHHQGA